MKTKLVSMILAVVMTFSLAGCVPTSTTPSASATGTSNEKSTATSYEPVTITCMQRTTTYKKAPERVIAFSFSTAEMLIALGLKDKLVGIATTHTRIEDVQEKYTSDLKDIPILADGILSLEGALKTNPDFCIGDCYNFMAKNSGTPEDYNKAGVNVYIQEGTYVEGATYENTYNDILNLGKIFNVQDRANKLVEEMKAKISQVESKVDNLNAISAFIYDSGEGTLQSVGRDSLESNIVKAAGGKNIFSDTEGHYIEVSTESVIERNPEVIIILDFFDEGGKDGNGKAAYLKGLPEMANVPAIKNNRIIVIPYANITPSLENSSVTEKIAEYLHPDVF